MICISKTLSRIILGCAILTLVIANYHNLFTSPGILTWPGIITGIVAMFLKPRHSATVAGLAGIISLAFQARMGFCLPCLMAATLFLMVCIIQCGRYRILCLLPILMLLFVSTNPTDKPILYFALGCSPCDQVLSICIKQDPLGEYWQPACLPEIYNEGERYLRSKGYAGSIKTGQAKIVPALQIGPKMYYTGVQGRVAEIFRGN